MLINRYVKPYLDFYNQINLLSMGTVYRMEIPVQKEDLTLNPKTYKYKMDDLVSENIDHFVLFISQYEEGSFESIKSQVFSDFQYCNDLLNNDQTIKFDGIGSIRIFNRRVTLFPETNENRTFGYPEITLKK